MRLAFREMRQLQQTSIIVGRHEGKEVTQEAPDTRGTAGIVRKLVNKVGKTPYGLRGPGGGGI